MAEKPPAYTKRIQRLEYLNVSSQGHPRIIVHFTDGTSAQTQDNASVNYDMGNLAGRGRPVKFWTTRAGRIDHAEPA